MIDSRHGVLLFSTTTKPSVHGNFLDVDVKLDTHASSHMSIAEYML